jgi:hypothetical protein
VQKALGQLVPDLSSCSSSLVLVWLSPCVQVLSGSCQFSVSLIAASIMVTQSPASAIAVVAEMKAKGQFTSTFLGITVLTDIVVLLLYSLCAAVANANCAADANGFHVLDLLITVLCLLAAGVFGYTFGKIIIFLLWIPRVHGEWAVLPLGYAVFKVSHWFTEWSTEEWGHGVNFDPLLICIFAGYVVANQSRNRRKFLRFMGSCGPIIFIPFFTLTGAGLNLLTMRDGAGFAVIVFVVRAVTFLVGSGLGGHYTGMEPLQLKTLWTAMLTQAGVSLGIAAEVAIAFPAFGRDFQSTIVSCVLINQVVGPVLCKWALRKNGEDGMAVGSEEEEDEEHHKRAVIVGINISSLAVASRLLKHDWNVLFIDTDGRKTDMIHWLKYERRKKPVRTPAEIKKRRLAKEARIAARAAARARAGFLDLNPPGSLPEEQAAAAAAQAAADAEAEVAAEAAAIAAGGAQPPVDEADIGLEHSSSGGGSQQYQPVQGEHEERVQVSSEMPPRAPAAASSAAGASSSRPPRGSGGVISSLEDTNNSTTTAPEEQQVQFLLLEPSRDVDLDPKDPLSKLKHARLALGLKAITWDLNEHNVNAALVCLDDDELNFDLCAVLQDNVHLKRVIAEVQNPNWTSMFASVGVLTVFPYSLAAHTVAQMVLTPEHGALELVSHTKPLHVSLSHVIRPDTLEGDLSSGDPSRAPLYLRNLAPEDQRAFASQHPDPPLPRDQLWKFNEKVKVVGAAMRDEYMGQIASLHGNNSIKLDHASSFGAAASAFQGPGMLDLTDGGAHGADPNDPEERKFAEMKREQALSNTAAKRARKYSRAIKEDQDD